MRISRGNTENRTIWFLKTKRPGRQKALVIVWCRVLFRQYSVGAHLRENYNLHFSIITLKKNYKNRQKNYKNRKKTMKMWNAIIGSSMAQYGPFIRFMGSHLFLSIWPLIWNTNSQKPYFKISNFFNIIAT